MGKIDDIRKENMGNYMPWEDLGERLLAHLQGVAFENKKYFFLDQYFLISF